jgi:glucose/arabinose dehydrogenase/type 1 glutamine amidotransferase/regulation of enolase protein 1 (concanavalin A-like superfamily)
MRRSRLVPSLLAFTAMVAQSLFATSVVAAADEHDDDYDVLFFHLTTGFRHDAIENAIAAVEELGADNGFSVTETQDPTIFNDDDLRQYAAVVFFTDGENTLNHNQRTAFERYMHRGGGFVGLHSTSNMDNNDWPWWEDLIGGFFVHHPAIQPGTVLVEDDSHPATAHLPAEWEWHPDEFYNFHRNPRDAGVHVLLTMDTSSYSGSQHPDDHPIAWCNEFDGGRTFYTALGHSDFHYDDPVFRQHILGGIEWSAGVADANCGEPREGPPTEAAFDKVALDDNTANPMMMDIASDGRVFYTELAGALKVYHPETQAITVAANVDVYRDHENGLLGIVLDPDFDENGWIYLFYSDPETTPNFVDNTIGGLQRLSRFTVSADSTLDMASEVALLEFPHQRAQCCHSSGDMVFDPAGNIYLSTGDDTNPFGSQNFAPIDYQPGREPWDAARSSGNTADLRGKVLRITPNPDAQPGDEPALGVTYTVPEDNLFTGGQYDHLFPNGEYDPDIGRPEIYVMGLRNPFKIGMDSQAGELWIGDVGPDSNPQGGFNPQRGPRGYDSWTKVTAASNLGWPFCYIKQEPYIEWDFATQTSGDAFDCENGATNLSPNNNGLEVLPPATERTIWYPYCPFTAPPPFPEVPSGNLQGGQNWGCGRAAFMGDVYHYDSDLDAEGKFPEYYDGKPFVIEWERDVIASVTMDDGEYVPDSLEEFAFRWRFDDDLRFRKPHDVQFGPDGNMYVIEWGDSFNFAGGGVNPDSGLYRISYIKGGRSPVARASATPDSGQPPLDVSFSSEGSFDPDGDDITFLWNLGDGTTSTEPDLSHVYEDPGIYNVQLVVTDESDNSSSSSLTITVGNTRPEVTIEFPHHGQVFNWGDEIAYQVTVTDAEDGSTEDGTIDCDDVTVQRGLWHRTGGAAHVHPGPSQTGCEGTILTQADADHGEGADIATLVTASYTDQGGHPDAQPLTGGVSHLLQPSRKQGQFFDETSGISVASSGDVDGGDAIAGQNGAWAKYEPFFLGGLDEVTLRASALSDTTVEVRRDAPDGPLLGTAEIEATTEIDRVSGPAGFGDAVRLNGPSPVQHVEMPEGIVSDLDGDFTIATWFNRAVTGQTWSRIFDFGTGQTVNMFLTPNAGGDNNGLRFAITTSGNAQEQQITHTGANQQLPTGWQHVAVTLSGNTGQLWLNGEVVATNTNMTLRPADLGVTTQNYIGNSQYPDPLINGTVDDFNIFSRALSQSDIQALMAEPGGGDTVGGGDVAWYQFDEDGGATAVDSSEQGNDASLVVSDTSAGWVNVPVELAPSAETIPMYLVFPEGSARINWFDFGDVPDDPVDPDPGELICEPTFEEHVDQFEGTELEAGWTIVEHEADTLTVADGSLQIQTVPGRDFFADQGTLPNVVVQALPDGAWTATAAMNWTPTQNFQNAGLVVWADEDNYVKAGMVHSGGRAFELIKEVDGSPDFQGFQGAGAEFPDDFFLRYVYDGSDLVAEFSADGESWSAIGTSDLSDLDDLSVGVYATNSTAAGATDPPLASFSSFSLGVEGTPERSVSDDFSGDELDGCRWSETVRYTPDLLEVADGQLQLTTTPNDIFGDATGLENIVLQTMPEGDWTIETKMHAPLARNFQNAGFMVYGDDDNYLKFGVVQLSQPGATRQLAAEMGHEIGGEPQTPLVNDPVPADNDEWWLRLTREGDTYSGEWSVDGVDWTPLSDSRSIDLQNASFGLYATGSGSQQAGQEVTVSFECFELIGEGEPGCSEPDTEPDISFSVDVEVRCVGGNAFLAVRVHNTDDVALDIDIDTPYGTRSFEGVAPGGSAYRAFNARTTSVPEGSVTVEVARTDDPQGESTTEVVPYEAHSCG